MIIFLFGPDTFRSQNKLKKIKEKFISSNKKIGVETLDALKTSKNQLHSSLFTQGFSKNRLIIIKNLFNSSPSLIEEVIKYLKKKSQPNIVIIYEKQINPNSLSSQAKDLFQLLKKKAKCQEFKILTPLQLKKYIINKLNEENIKIKSLNAELLINQCKSNLWEIESSLEALISLVKEEKEKEITQKQIMSLCPEGLNEEDIFYFLNTLGKKDKKQAFKILNHLLNQKESFEKIIFSLAKQFLNIYRLKSKLKEKKSLYSIAKELNLHPYYLSKLAKFSNNYTQEQIKKVYHQLLTIDLKRKTINKVNQELLLSLLLEELI